jgi:hypothetical protein
LITDSKTHPTSGDIRNGATSPDRWDDIDIRPADDPAPLFEEGAIVEVRVAGSRVTTSFDGSWRVELVCEVIEDERRKVDLSQDGEVTCVRLSLFFKLPRRRGGRGAFEPAPLGSKFYRMWVLANRGQKPVRRDRMPVKIFKDRLFMARTRAVTKDHRGRPLPLQLQYSVIDEFVS